MKGKKRVVNRDPQTHGILAVGGGTLTGMGCSWREASTARDGSFTSLPWTWTR